jgi:DEAD/DEAH box helicase domain-containing protein
MNDPDWFFRKSAEEARIDPDNPYILTDHVKCACFELPFTDAELADNSGQFANNKGQIADNNGQLADNGGNIAANGAGIYGGNARDALEYLEEAGIVRHTGGKWHWADRSFPAEGVSLRSAGADNVVIIDVTEGRNAVIGEMDRPSAKELIFVNAVYIHRGRQYMVEELDIENRKCRVREADVNYFTDGLVKTDIKVLTEDEKWTVGQSLEAVLGDVLVRSQVTKFKKLKFRTHENIGSGDITLPEEEMQTRGLSLLFAPETSGGRVLESFDEQGVGEALSGAGTLIRNIAPVFLLCDPRDLGIAERVKDPHFAVPALYIYDKYPGGTGLTESLARRIEPLLRAILEAIGRCPCRSGCPSCVGPGGNKKAAAEFIRAMC